MRLMKSVPMEDTVEIQILKQGVANHCLVNVNEFKTFVDREYWREKISTKHQ